MIIDFNRLNWLINRQISSTIEYYRLIDYIFDDRFLSICYVLYYAIEGQGHACCCGGPNLSEEKGFRKFCYFIYTVVFSVLAWLKLEDRCKPGGKSTAMWCGHRIHQGQFIFAKWRIICENLCLCTETIFSLGDFSREKTSIVGTEIFTEVLQVTNCCYPALHRWLFIM